MPSKYGPAGKWVHDRAHRLMRSGDLQERYGEKRGKQIAYAVGVQQAHKVGKSPKGFRTPQGVRTAKAKMTGPVKEYRKTAALAGFFDELAKVAETIGQVQARAVAARRAAGGSLTPAVQRLHTLEAAKRQAALKALPSRMASYKKSLGRVAKKPQAAGLGKRLFGGLRRLVA